MSGDEPAVVCWRVEELDAALAAAHDMGLPVALAEDVAEALGFESPRPGSVEEQLGRERETPSAPEIVAEGVQGIRNPLLTAASDRTLAETLGKAHYTVRTRLQLR